MTTGRACAALVGALASALLAAGPASAGLAATAAGPAGAATTGSWAATLVRADGTVLTGRPWSTSYASLVTTYAYGAVRNTGTLALTGQTYSLTWSSLAAPVVDACVGGNWQSATGACAGTVVRLATNGTTTTRLALAPGEAVGLRVTLPATFGSTVTLSASTSRAHVRAATATNS